MQDSPANDDVLTWEVQVPLWTSPLIVGATFKIYLIAACGLALTLSLVFALRREFDAIVVSWLVVAMAMLGLFALSLLVAALVLGNRLQCEYTVDKLGVLFAMTDGRARNANALLLSGGFLRGRQRAGGAVALAQSQEFHTLRWRGAFRAEFQPRRHLVILRNRWRRLMLIYTRPDNYAQVAERIARELQRHGTAERMPASSPLPRYLLHSAVVMLACLPLFALVEAFELPLALPLLQLCFGLATVWIIGWFGHALVALDAIIGVALLLQGGWKLATGQQWGLLLLAVLGMAALAWIGRRGVRGRLPAMLMADFKDAGV